MGFDVDRIIKGLFKPLFILNCQIKFVYLNKTD